MLPKPRRMKNVLLLFALMLSGISICSAQYKGQFRVQYSGEFKLKDKFYGNSLGGEYFPFEMVSFAPSVTLFTPATGKASGLDFNARYYVKEGDVEFYGLAGYALYRRRFEFNPKGLEQFSTLNIGIGGIFKFIDELGLNPEIRYQPQNNNEFLIKIGMVYFIN